MKRPSNVAYLIEPRFPGGTSAAVARELEVVRDFASVTVHLHWSKMFGAREIAKPLRRILDDPSLTVVENPDRIAADLVVVHNPCFLKFNTEFNCSIVARHLVAVTHENFLRPGAQETFDVSRCLGYLERSGAALRRSLAPVSRYNRETVMNWLAGRQEAGSWRLLSQDWHNICSTRFEPPSTRPTDRRGRHSRPGFEKFPALAEMDACFPAKAEKNVILGADAFIRDGLTRPHWTMLPFQGIELPEYFEMIDFMVYFCAPTYRESFGRVIADATSAGKVVITDPETASVFGPGVVSAQPSEVDDIIQRFVETPALYAAQVQRAQEDLRHFSAKAFRASHEALFSGSAGVSAA